MVKILSTSCESFTKTNYKFKQKNSITLNINKKWIREAFKWTKLYEKETVKEVFAVPRWKDPNINYISKQR